MIEVSGRFLQYFFGLPVCLLLVIARSKSDEDSMGSG